MFLCARCGATYTNKVAFCSKCSAKFSITGPGEVGQRLEPDPLIGTQVGNYRLQGILGSGGMGTVYRAEHVVLEKAVAVKVLNEAFIGRQQMVARFVLEAKAVSKIGHENIIEVMDFGETEQGQPFFVMELLEGESLGSMMSQSTGINVKLIMNIFDQICDALAAAHSKNIIHRDIKPDNIFIVRRTKQKEFVKLLDFGVAKVLDQDTSAASLTQLGMIIGTPHYMSPEQAGGDPVDHRSDIYTLGVLLYEIFTGRRPFTGKSLSELTRKQLFEAPAAPIQVNSDIPSELGEFILKVLAKSPDERPQSIVEFFDALKSILEGLLVRDPDMTVPVTRLVRRLTPVATPGGTPAPNSPAPKEHSAADDAETVASVEAEAPPALAESDIPIDLATAFTQPGVEKKPSPVIWVGLGVVVLSLVVGGAVIFWPDAPVVTPRPDPKPVAVVPAPKPALETKPEVAKPEVVKPVDPIPNRFSVHVKSTPRGASIFEGSKLLGKTPSVLEFEQETRLELRRRGFKTVKLEASPEKPEISIKLDRRPSANRRKVTPVKRPPRAADPTLD